jgi:hypothetical protein
LIAHDPSFAQIMGNVENDPLISLAAAAKLLPGEHSGKGVSPATVYRWGTRGLPLSGGQVIKLAMWRIGRKWVTTRGALANFVAAQQPDVMDRDVYPRSASQRRKSSEIASRQLAEKGI